jgi:hypothetical protein
MGMIAFYQNTMETVIAILFKQEKLLPSETTSLHRQRDGDHFPQPWGYFPNSFAPNDNPLKVVYRCLQLPTIKR